MKKKPDTLTQFTLTIYDAAGLWGSLQLWATSLPTAIRKARAHLRETEVEPHGSLQPKFTVRQEAR